MERRMVSDTDILLPWQLDKWLKSDVKILFGDNKEFSIRYDSSSGVYVVRDESAGSDVIKIGSAGIIVDGNVSAGTIKSGNVLLKKSASPTVAPSGTTPTEVTVVEPDANHEQVIPLGGSVTAGGTFGTNETVTVTIIAHYSDGTTGSITKTFTATGTQDLTSADIVALVKDGVYITSIGAEASSSLTSTSATVSVEIAAMQG